MFESIWNQSELSKLTGHKKPMVRQWACERIRILYGEAGVEVLERLLTDKNRDVLLEALKYLENYPDPKFKGTILKIYEIQTGVIAQECSLLLGKLKDERLLPAYEKKVRMKTVKFEGVISAIKAMGELATDQARAILRKILSETNEETDPLIISSLIHALLEAKEDFSNLLDYYARFYRKFSMKILYPFVSICGAWFSLEDMEEDGKKKTIGKSLPHVVLESLAYIKDKGVLSLEKELRQAFKKKEYRQVIEIAWLHVEKAVDEKRSQVGEAFLFESNSPSLLNYQILKAFKEFLRNGPEDSYKGIAIAALIILSKFVEFESLLGLKIEKMSEETLLQTFLEDRDTVKSDDRLMERLLRVGHPETTFGHCIRQLKDHPYSYGTGRALRLLGRIKDQRAIPYLVGFFKREGEDNALDECIQTLVQIGSPFIDYLEKNFEKLNQDQLSESLFVLKDIPEEKTVDFLVRHWNTLWSFNKELFLYALEGVASKKFIEPLRKELKEGEEMEEEVFYLLCQIHAVDDLLLPEIGRNIDQRRKETEQRLNALMRNDSKIGPDRIVRVELRCRKCEKTYHYEVENICLIPEEKGKPRIMDKIVCKNCKAVNQYEITTKGYMAITSQAILSKALIDEGKAKVGEGPVKFVHGAGLMDGQRMSFEDILEYYKKEVQKSPNDPALRVGYGNVLLKAGTEDEAILQYQEALKLDSLAVEAYCSLGEYEADKGNLSQAYEYFDKAADRIHTGHYYRTKEVDQLKEAIISNRDYYEERLGKGSEQTPLRSSQEIIKKGKVGRNDPCPCGSGKKYKKCCLLNEEIKSPEKTSATPKEIELRDRLLSFSAKERYKKDFERAYLLYWRRPFEEPLMLNEKEEVNFGFFLDWFIHDFILKSGMTIVEEFYREKKERLSEEECSLLRYEMASYCSVYEVISVTPEAGLRLKDLFTSEEMEIFEVKGSLTAVKWDVIFARVIRMVTVNKFSGIITLVPRRNKEEIISSIRSTWEKIKEETGQLEWSSFMKLNAQLIHHLIEDQSLKKPSFVTEEYHRICSSKAVFDVKNFETIRYRFGQEFDFIIDEEKVGEKVLFTWLKRGPSKHWETETEKPPEGSVMLRSEMIRGKGELKWTSLGTITLTPKRLELWCLSRERLDRGKKRLQEILGDDIQHRIDTYEDLVKKVMESSGKTSSVEEDKMPGKYFPLFSKVVGDLVEKWVDEKIPALDGKTPREAVETPEGREKVEELLKGWENVEERKRKEGEPYIDINILRQMLNL